LKQPAFQFYPADWLTDVELQSASATSRGIWINALCLMWESKTRGQLSGKASSLSRILNCTIDEFEAFVEEVQALKFAEVSVTSNADVRFCNSEVTLINRRMFNEEKVRQQTRLRVKKHRGNAARNGEVTHASSSSSSCTKVQEKEKEIPQSPSSASTPRATSDQTPEQAKAGTVGGEGRQVPEGQESRNGDRKGRELPLRSAPPLQLLEIHEIYPARSGVKEPVEDAIPAWLECKGRGELPGTPELGDAIARLCQTDQWQRDGGRYIPSLASFIRRRLWRTQTDIHGESGEDPLEKWIREGGEKEARHG
jgi:hypothetical protein